MFIENMESDLYKIRGLVSCMEAAFALFISNIATILKRTWLPALLFSIASSIFGYFIFSSGIDLLLSPSLPYAAIKTAVIVITYLCSFAALIWHSGTILSLITKQNIKYCIWREAKIKLTLFVTSVLVTLILGVIFIVLQLHSPANHGITPAEQDAVTSWFNTAVLAVSACFMLFVVIFIPLLYSAFTYLIDDKQTLSKTFMSQYIAGWKHWHLLFMLALLTGIIEMVIMAVCYLPVIILMLSLFFDKTGVFIGDADTLPSLFPAIFIGTNIFVQFIIVYVVTWASFVFYYAAGSIEARIEQKNMMAKYNPGTV